MPSLLILAMLAIAIACTGPADGITPYADYHVHLLGPYAAPAARYREPITADRLVADLDKAGIERALVLSEAFWIGGPGGGTVPRLAPAKDLATAVQFENDWTARQVARYPDRLVMACGINPLDAWAMSELERCSRIPGVRAIKLNVSDGGDDIDFHDPTQVKTLRDFFAAANARHLPIVIHLGSRGGDRLRAVRPFPLAARAPLS